LGVKLTRLVIVVFLAVILSAPASAAVSPDGRHGDVLVQARKQLARVVTELR
jgi:hypothetical protein